MLWNGLIGMWLAIERIIAIVERAVLSLSFLTLFLLLIASIIAWASSGVMPSP
jgi:hypothetical protein